MASPDTENPETMIRASESQAANDFHRNLRCNCFVEGFWGVGMAFCSQTAIMPLFLVSLGISSVGIGLLGTIMWLGLGSFQLVSSYFSIGMSTKKRPMILLHIPAILPWAVVGLITIFGGNDLGNLLVVLAFLAWGMFWAALGTAIPLWGTFWSKVIQESRRGEFFGKTFFVSGLCAAIGSVVAWRVLHVFPGITGFGICFVIASLAMGVGVVWFIPIKELPHPHTRRPPVKKFVAGLWTILKEDRNYRGFIVGKILISVSTMSVLFYPVCAKEWFDIPDSAAGIFGMLTVIAQTGVSLAIARFADRVGFRRVAILSSCLSIAGALVALSENNIYIFSLCFVFSGGAFAAYVISHLNLMMELCPHHEKSVYFALANTVSAPFQAILPLLGALLISIGSYRLLFISSALLGVLAIAAFACFVPPARTKDMREGAKG